MNASGILRRNMLTVLQIMVVLLLATFYSNTSLLSAAAETLPDRTPTFSTTHGTATAMELATAMDVPPDMIIAASLGTSDPTGTNVFAGDGTFTGFAAPTIAWIPAHGNNYKVGRTRALDSIVIHYLAGDAKSGINTFQHPSLEHPVSAHYIIKDNGEIVQMVQDGDTAYHATYYNARSIGIELEGSGSITDYTPEMYRSLANLINHLKANHPGIVMRHPTEMATKNADGSINCLDVAGIVGHAQVQPFWSEHYSCLEGWQVNAKVDPGPNFDWRRVLFAVLSSGNAADALKPNTSGSLSTVLGGLNNSQGNDLVQLTLTLKVPSKATRWAVDWKFLSEEYPEWVGSSYNDAFLIETPSSTFTISGTSIVAPNNVALDPSGNLVTVNTVGVVGMSAANAAGTTYDGATATLTAGAPIPAGASTITIIFSVMDLGDSIYDTTVFLDNFRFIEPIHVEPMGTYSLYAYVPPGQVQAVFSTSWAGSDVVMTLVDPSGRVIDRNTTAGDVLHELGPNFENYTIFNPIAGYWQVNLFGADVPPEGEDVEFVLGFSTFPPPLAPSTYKFEYSIPDLIIVATDVDIDVTFMTREEKDIGYDGVRFRFEADGPGDVIFTATDSEGVEHTFLNNGFWGPSAGFDLPALYEATTTWTLNFLHKAGDYTITFSLIEAPDGDVIADITETVTVTVKPLPAAVTIDPETLNLQAPAKWITAYIELPADYAAEDIDISTVHLLYNGEELYADWGDIQDGVFMAKFDWVTVAGWFDGLNDVDVELTVAGEVDGVDFAGTDTIRIIDPPRRGGRG